MCAGAIGAGGREGTISERQLTQTLNTKQWPREVRAPAGIGQDDRTRGLLVSSGYAALK